ncbi:MAG: hypothetical protein IJ558_04685 [Treponema sp.]|nr:hypothetical protein [Treponema sp.]
MTKIIAIPINPYKDKEKPALHFKSFTECAEALKFPLSRIQAAFKTGEPVKGYCIDEEIEQ